MVTEGIKEFYFIDPTKEIPEIAKSIFFVSLNEIKKIIIKNYKEIIKEDGLILIYSFLYSENPKNKINPKSAYTKVINLTNTIDLEQTLIESFNKVNDNYYSSEVISIGVNVNSNFFEAFETFWTDEALQIMEQKRYFFNF